MCRYIETIHTYEKCKLQDSNENDTPSPLAKFYHQLTENLTNYLRPGRAHTNDDAVPPADDEQAQLNSGIHMVVQTEVIQCANAVNDYDQRNLPRHERRCAELAPLRPDEPMPTRPQVTENLGALCTVCVAGEEAMAAALKRVVIVPVEDLRQTAANPVRHRSNKNGQRPERVHHGRDRNRDKGRENARVKERVRDGDGGRKKKRKQSEDE